MQPTPEQSQLFTQLSFAPSSLLVNDRVSFQTEDDQRVIYVQGVIFAHYSREDRCAEAYALVKLYESGYADQNDLARCFGYSTRTLRRYQQRLETGGLSALVRPGGRPVGGSTGPAPLSARSHHPPSQGTRHEQSLDRGTFGPQRDCGAKNSHSTRLEGSVPAHGCPFPGNGLVLIPRRDF